MIEVNGRIKGSIVEIFVEVPNYSHSRRFDRWPGNRYERANMLTLIERDSGERTIELRGLASLKNSILWPFLEIILKKFLEGEIAKFVKFCCWSYLPQEYTSSKFTPEDVILGPLLGLGVE